MKSAFKYPLAFLVFLTLTGLFLLSGCRDDSYDTSPDLRLRFSTDSVKFDTVFTTVGSATHIFTVYNDADSYVNIGQVKLNNDANNSYRINVDGISGSAINDVEIGPRDSIFVFVEVTVQPDADALYPFVEGNVEFVTNGNSQQVKLVANGWDAIFYTPSRFPVNGLPDYTLIDTLNPTATVTWTKEKPIVVYGYLVVDSLQSLIIEPGTQVFFHQGSGLWIYRDGNISAEGTVEEPIVFQGDRLEPFYEEQPGQWDRIWINESNDPNRDNVFKNVVIKNNFIGIQAETLPFNSDPDPGLSANSLKLKNVVIRNNSIASVYSRNYRVEGDNLSLSSSGQYLLAGIGRGKYTFNQCTFANNWTFGTRQTPAVYLSNLVAVSSTQVQAFPIAQSTFRNCIVYGNALNELELDFDTGGGQVPIDLTFNSCLIRGEEEVLEPYAPFFTGTIYVGQNPGFVDFAEGDFHLIPEAFVRDKGVNAPGLPPDDLDGVPYSAPRPLGCYTLVE